jgi:hypothetical protein
MCIPFRPHSYYVLIVIILGEEHKLWSSSLCSFLQPPVTSSLCGSNILLSTLFSNTLSLLVCSSLNVRDEVSQPYRTTGKIIVFFIYSNKKQEVEELIAYVPWYDTDRIENEAFNNSSVVAYVFVATVTFLPNSCLATIRGYTYRHTDWWEGFIKYGAEVGSDVMIYIPSLIKIGLTIQQLIGRIHRYADSMVVA